jgi:hypothetical protein
MGMIAKTFDANALHARQYFRISMLGGIIIMDRAQASSTIDDDLPNDGRDCSGTV